MNETAWKGKRVVIIGAGRSGVAAGHLLLDCGAEVTITDLRHAVELPDLEELGSRGARLACGGHPPDLWQGADAAVVSPGIAPDEPPVEAARAAGIRLVAEIELAVPFLTPPVVAITGSNGKSTVTSMAGAVLRTAGHDVAVCGNIGLPLCVAVRGARQRGEPYSAYVIELSSFQTEAIERFHPDLAVFLNITPDHLDRHGSMPAYAAAKARLVKNSGAGDWVVVNADDPLLNEALPATGAHMARFSRRRLDAGPGAWIEGGSVRWRHPGGDEETVMAVADLGVVGPHNESNACAAAAIGSLLGVERERVAEALSSYRALEHRTELCGYVGGVACFNDSKATNVDATLAALAGFDRGVWLILGGRDKGADFGQLCPLLPGRVERVLLIGEASARIAAAIGGAAPVEACDNLEVAVANALDAASEGDVLLLSPACTSFDQYTDFEARGRHFKQLMQAHGATAEPAGSAELSRQATVSGAGSSPTGEES